MYLLLRCSGRYDYDGLSEYGLETSVLQSMDQVRSVKAGKDENEMLLVDQDGNVLLVLERN